MVYVIHSEVVGDILIDAYSDLLYASFVCKGKRHTQCYKLDASEDEIKKDAEEAVKFI